MFNGNINAVISFIIPIFTGLTCIMLALIVKLFLKSKVLSIFSSTIYLLLVWQVHMSIENYAQLFSILYILIGIIILKTEKIKYIKVKKLFGYFIIAIGVSYYFLLTLVLLTAYILFIRLEIGDSVHNKIMNSIGILKTKKSLIIFYIFASILIILLYFIFLETPIVTFTPLGDIYAYFNQLFLKGFKLFQMEPIWLFIANNIPFLLVAPFGIFIWLKYFRYNKIVNIIFLIFFFFVGFEFFGVISSASYFSPRILFYIEFLLITLSAIFFLKFWKKIIVSKSYPKIIKKIFPLIVLIPFISGFVIQIPYNRIENFDKNSIEMLDWLVTYDQTLKNNNRSDSIIITNVKSEYWAILYSGEQIFLLPAHLRTFWALYSTYENEPEIIQQLIDNTHIRIYFFINNAVEKYDSFYSSEEIVGILEEFGKLNKSYSTIYNVSSNVIIQINISDD
jgi:hypothetical protein